MANDTLSGYDLSRSWFDFCFKNPEKVSPNHTAIFFFAIEHCNRLGWKEKFGLPTEMAKDAIGIAKHQTYIKYFNEIVEWGFFILVQKSSNQYSSNIISLANGLAKNGKALDKAIIRHGAKQSSSIGQSIGQSNSPINKQVTNKQINHKPINNITGAEAPEDEKSLFNSIKKSFMDMYSEKFSNEYYFRAIDGKKIKSIISKIKFKIKEKNSAKKESGPITNDQILAAYQYYQSKAFDVGDAWINSNFSLSTLDSKFNDLYTQIKNGKPSTNNSDKRAASRAELEILTSRSAEFLQSVATQEY